MEQGKGYGPMTEVAAVTFSHEKLDAYQAFLSLAELSNVIVADAGAFAVADQLERATESIGANLIRGNSQWTKALRENYLNISMASALECAACMDVCLAKELADFGRLHQAKRHLYDIVNMLFGLRRSSGTAHEDEVQYGEVRFAHERLDVYRLGLDFVKWSDAFVKEGMANSRETKKLDAVSTSTVLNIAEGNGRFSPSDRSKFIETAHASALQCVLSLDLMMARHRATMQAVIPGKNMLGRISAMLLAWRRKLAESPESLS